jgi:hypothetical protein
LPSSPGGSFDVRSYGAVGDGRHDDSEALQRALADAAAAGGTVYLPAGTYLCPTAVKLPDDVQVRGAGESSWLKGELWFGSGDTLARLKIGADGDAAVTNQPDAVGTTFSDCRLHGGGSKQGPDSSVVYLGGLQGNVSRVLFQRCQIERSSYVPPAGIDPYAANVGNTVTIHEFSYLPHSGHVERITFLDCRLGASNGVATGAVRTMVEAYTWDNNTGLAYHGWRDLAFEGCTVEASDMGGLDFSDKLVSATGRRSSTGVLVTGCTFLGAARDGTYGHGGLPITYECPTGMVVRDNVFYASPHETIGGSHVGNGAGDAPGLLVEGNTFDMTKSPIGQQHERGEPCVSLVGHGSRLLHNRFVYAAGLGVLIKAGSGDTVFAATGNVVSANTFIDTRATGGEPSIQLTDDFGLGCNDNRIADNSIRNRAAGSAGVIAQTSGSGTNYAVNNRIDCGSAVPFVVTSGQLVRHGNVIVGP